MINTGKAHYPTPHPTPKNTRPVRCTPAQMHPWKQPLAKMALFLRAADLAEALAPLGPGGENMT